MKRNDLIRALRKYARKNKLHFELYKNKGDGSHYTVEVGSKHTIIQYKLTPFKIRTILEQLDIDPAAL